MKIIHAILFVLTIFVINVDAMDNVENNIWACAWKGDIEGIGKFLDTRKFGINGMAPPGTLLRKYSFTDEKNMGKIHSIRLGRNYEKSFVIFILNDNKHSVFYLSDKEGHLINPEPGDKILTRFKSKSFNEGLKYKSVMLAIDSDSVYDKEAIHQTKFEDANENFNFFPSIVWNTDKTLFMNIDRGTCNFFTKKVDKIYPLENNATTARFIKTSNLAIVFSESENNQKTVKIYSCTGLTISHILAIRGLKKNIEAFKNLLKIHNDIIKNRNHENYPFAVLNLSRKDCCGNTVMDFAKHFNNKKIITILDNYSCKTNCSASKHNATDCAICHNALPSNGKQQCQNVIKPCNHLICNKCHFSLEKKLKKRETIRCCNLIKCRTNGIGCGRIITNCEKVFK